MVLWWQFHYRLLFPKSKYLKTLKNQAKTLKRHDSVNDPEHPWISLNTLLNHLDRWIYLGSIIRHIRKITVIFRTNVSRKVTQHSKFGIVTSYKWKYQVLIDTHLFLVTLLFIFKKREPLLTTNFWLLLLKTFACIKLRNKNAVCEDRFF